MEEQNRDAALGRSCEDPVSNLPEGSGWAESALAPQAPPFSASGKEKISAFLMYLLAFCYVQMLFSPPANAVWLCIFCAGFVFMTELLCCGRKRSRESWVWLACLLVLIGFRIRLSIEAARYGENAPVHAVGAGLSFFLLHAYAVYWVLSRSDTLLGDGSGHLLPLDALDGMVIFPFRHFILRIRTVIYTLTHLRREGSGEKRSSAMRAGIFAAVLAACALLILALRALSDADTRFGAAVSGLLAALTPDWNDITLVDFLLKFCLSLPVGAYLFGLLAGTARLEPQQLRARGGRFEASLEKLRHVPTGILAAAAAVFAAVYLAFFGLQASYLFGAFTRTLPEGYTVAEYARQGFFSLCRVMAVNFALLWLITRTGVRQPRTQQLLRILCTVLLAQSLLFAVIAASKLALYITSYGFTPLRLQSAWLIVVLTAGCCCALYSLWNGKHSFRFWTLFSGVTLALLHLY